MLKVLLSLEILTGSKHVQFILEIEKYRTESALSKGVVPWKRKRQVKVYLSSQERRSTEKPNTDVKSSSTPKFYIRRGGLLILQGLHILYLFSDVVKEDNCKEITSMKANCRSHERQWIHGFGRQLQGAGTCPFLRSFPR